MHAGLPHHVVHERDVVDHRAQLRDGFRQQLPALTEGPEVPHRTEPRPQTVLKRLDLLAEIARLPVTLHKLRLEVEQIDMTGRPGHEELHHPLGPGSDMRDDSSGLAGKQMRQRQAGERLEEGTAGEHDGR